LRPPRDIYLGNLAEATKGIDLEVMELEEAIFELHKAGKRLWILGNGGSLAVAQHFAQDLVKARGVRAQCLNDPSVITAYSNDQRFDYCFYAPLRVLMAAGDGVLVFSCSGKSRNFIEFISQETVPLFAVVGTDGGFLKEKAKVCVHVESQDYALCETAFSMVADLINYGLEERMKGIEDAKD